MQRLPNLLTQNRVAFFLPAFLGAACSLTVSLPARSQDAVADVSAEAITLDQIMADPDWLGRAPEGGYWAEDSQSVYYRRKRAGSPVSDWYEADLQGNLLRVVADEELAEAGTRQLFMSSAGALSWLILTML